MEEAESEYTLAMPFWIDTDGYSDRDRLLFCCGVEFEMIRQELKTGEPISRPIHTENETRVRLMCGKLKRRCEIQTAVAEGWSQLEVQSL